MKREVSDAPYPFVLLDGFPLFLAKDMNEKDGFEKECLQKYDSVLFEEFTDLMTCLPFATVVNKKVLSIGL